MANVNKPSAGANSDPADTNAPMPSSSNGPSPSTLAQPANRNPVPGHSVAGGLPKPSK